MLSNLQKCERRDAQNNSYDPEAGDDARFDDALFLVMVVEGGHQEDPPAFTVFLSCIFKVITLDEDAHAFGDEDAAEDGEEELLAREDGADADDAARMLRALSGRTHQVTTGVCMVAKDQDRRFSVTTDVTFKQLTDEEINYYIQTYKPYDKAGAYGIQEWIGCIGVTGLSGSYYNVMGLPIQRIYQVLKSLGVMPVCE